MTTEVTMEFMTGNPQLGVLSGRLTYLDDDRKIASTSPANAAGTGDGHEGKEEKKHEGFSATRFGLINLRLPTHRGTLLCILSVPAHMIPTDMLQFAAPFKEHVHSVRVVRPCTPAGPSDSARTPAEYMVLLQMESQASADDFFLQCNGKHFNSFEESTCRVVFVSTTTFDLNPPAAAVPSTNGPAHGVPALVTVIPSSFEGSTNAAAGAATAATAATMEDSDSTLNSDSPPSTLVHSTLRFSPVTKPAHGNGAAVVAGAAGTSMPTLSPEASEHGASTCVICMERMESRVLTTVCNHSFHVECLVKWQDSPCPVCRFHHNNASEASTCQECQATDNLWVCLICGSVLCGSRHEDHVLGHYGSTLHAYAIEIETQQVWDFAGDGFVHRLIRNKADGKLVEISDPGQTSKERPQVPARLSDIQEERLVHGKLEGLAYQFNTLLTSQLNEQRHFYQKQLNGLLEQQEKDRRDRRSKVVASGADLMAALRQQRRELESKCASATERLRKITEETVFIRELNRSLEANREQWSISLEQAQQGLASARTTLEKEVPKCEEKVAQLMLKLDAASATTGNDDGEGCGIAVNIDASGHDDRARPSKIRGPTTEDDAAENMPAARLRRAGGTGGRGRGAEERKGAAPVGGGLSCGGSAALAARKGATPDEEGRGFGPTDGKDAASASASAPASVSGGGKKKGRRRKCK